MGAHRKLLSTAAAILVVLVLGGCADGNQDRRFDDHVVSRSLVDRYPQGTPARALLELMRAFQFNAPTAAARYFAPAWRLTPAKMAPAMRTTSRVAAAVGVPTILGTLQRGNRAFVVIRWGNLLRVPMERVSGEWKLAVPGSFRKLLPAAGP